MDNSGQILHSSVHTQINRLHNQYETDIYTGYALTALKYFHCLFSLYVPPFAILNKSTTLKNVTSNYLVFFQYFDA